MYQLSDILQIVLIHLITASRRFITLIKWLHYWNRVSGDEFYAILL